MKLEQQKQQSLRDPPSHSLIIAIYGPMIYMAPYVMFLMRANPLQGPLEGLGHESQVFFGP